MSLKLRSIANSMTVAVNENTEALLKVADGFTVTPDGTQVPSYVQQERILQTQSMDVEDLAHLGFASQQGQFMLCTSIQSKVKHIIDFIKEITRSFPSLFGATKMH